MDSKPEDCIRAGPGRPKRLPGVESHRRSNLKRERILFVCTANVDRSRTAEDLYARDPRYEVLSAGTAAFATTPVSRELLLWAERVFVMCERRDGHQSALRQRFPGVERDVVDLDIEDRWLRGDPELVRHLIRRLAPHLGPPQRAALGDNGPEVEG